MVAGLLASVMIRAEMIISLGLSWREWVAVGPILEEILAMSLADLSWKETVDRRGLLLGIETPRSMRARVLPEEGSIHYVSGLFQ